MNKFPFPECPLPIGDLFEPGHCLLDSILFSENLFCFLQELPRYIQKWIAILNQKDYQEIVPGVWAHRKSKIAGTATLIGPAVIEEGTEIRPGAYIRENVLIGRGCVVGHDTEIKQSILMDEAQAPHFNYVGDSILGHRSHLGAGVILSNFRADHEPITLHYGSSSWKTPLEKMGAFLGDQVEVGCQTVLNPGTIIGKESRIYPLCSVRGTLPPHSLMKKTGEWGPLMKEGD